MKGQYLLGIKAVTLMEHMPPELVINWDHTGISFVPGSSWTMQLKGSKQVEIVGITDKHQIDAVLCGSMKQGSYEDITKDYMYIGKIIVLYVKCKQLEVKLSPEHPALAIFDVFRTGDEGGLLHFGR